MKVIEIEKKIIEMAGKLLNIEVSEIKTTSLVVKDLGADSLDIIELVMDLEGTFGIDIPDSDIDKFEDDITIKHLVDLVESKMKG
jgi:acyl carrier protein